MWITVLLEYVAAKAPISAFGRKIQRISPVLRAESVAPMLGTWRGGISCCFAWEH
jgi:hypothetical protein